MGHSKGMEGTLLLGYDYLGQHSLQRYGLEKVKFNGINTFSPVVHTDIFQRSWINTL